MEKEQLAHLNQEIQNGIKNINDWLENETLFAYLNKLLAQNTHELPKDLRIGLKTASELNKKFPKEDKFMHKNPRTINK